MVLNHYSNSTSVEGETQTNLRCFGNCCSSVTSSGLSTPIAYCTDPQKQLLSLDIHLASPYSHQEQHSRAVLVAGISMLIFFWEHSSIVSYLMGGNDHSMAGFQFFFLLSHIS
jgi:hypothetical protein